MPRQSEWKDNLFDFNLASGQGNVQSLVANFTEPDKRGMTLIRTIIHIEMFSNTVAGAYGVQVVSAGIGVASQEAFAIGATAISDPQTESDKPTRGWVWRTQIAVSQNGTGLDLVRTISRDIRAVRKLENGELFIVFDSDPGVGTAFTMSVRGLVRTLFKLP